MILKIDLGDNRRGKGNDRVARPTFVEKDRFASRNKLQRIICLS